MTLFRFFGFQENWIGECHLKVKLNRLAKLLREKKTKNGGKPIIF